LFFVSLFFYTFCFFITSFNNRACQINCYFRSKLLLSLFCCSFISLNTELLFSDPDSSNARVRLLKNLFLKHNFPSLFPVLMCESAFVLSYWSIVYRKLRACVYIEAKEWGKNTEPREQEREKERTKIGNTPLWCYVLGRNAGKERNA
jgi:cellulose synthase/poly-beta-1,6-N-acetylglucosamine synthase-like glycosyltransferase